MSHIIKKPDVIYWNEKYDEAFDVERQIILELNGEYYKFIYDSLFIEIDERWVEINIKNPFINQRIPVGIKQIWDIRAKKCSESGKSTIPINIRKYLEN